MTNIHTNTHHHYWLLLSDYFSSFPFQLHSTVSRHFYDRDVCLKRRTVFIHWFIVKKFFLLRTCIQTKQFTSISESTVTVAEQMWLPSFANNPSPGNVSVTVRHFSSPSCTVYSIMFNIILSFEVRYNTITIHTVVINL